MSVLRAMTAPFRRLFNALKTVNEQTYCGDSQQCQGLSYHKGNLNQDIPQRIPNWDSCEMPRQEQRAPR